MQIIILVSSQLIHLQTLGSWHIEHVIAFSENPTKNDVLGNMLASCQNCNLKKLDRPLIDCVQIFAHDLDTKAADASHLNTEARTCLLVALKLKHELFHNMVIRVIKFSREGGSNTNIDK